jgi:hypothetical protein
MIWSDPSPDWKPLTLLSVRVNALGTVRFWVEGSVFHCSGGLDPLGLFAAGIRNLAAIERTGTPPHVKPHIDEDYFPGHPYLSPDSYSATFQLWE